MKVCGINLSYCGIKNDLPEIKTDQRFFCNRDTKFNRFLQSFTKSTEINYCILSVAIFYSTNSKKNNVFGQYLSVNPLKLDTERTLNAHKMFGRRPGRQVIVLYVQVGREIEGIQISQTTSVLERVVIESP